MEVDPDREPRTAETFWSRVHPEDRDVIRADANRAVAEFRTFRLEYRANLPSGRKAEFLVQGRAVYDHAGRPLCVTGVTWDITAQKQRERDLTQREAMLTQAERMANFGTWYHDFRTDKATGSPDLARIYGVHPPEDWGELQYLDRYDPADLAEALRNVERGKRECGTCDTTLRLSPHGWRATNLPRALRFPSRGRRLAHRCRGCHAGRHNSRPARRGLAQEPGTAFARRVHRQLWKLGTRPRHRRNAFFTTSARDVGNEVRGRLEYRIPLGMRAPGG